jgi:predicted RND superfamily exporter protein
MNTNKYSDLIIKYRWPIVLIVPLLILILSTELRHLAFEGNSRIWFEEGSEILSDYDLFKMKFGADKNILISFSDEDGIFTKKALKTINRITEKLWTTKHVSRVDSITNYQYVHADINDPDDILVDDFIRDIDKLSEEELKEKEKIAISDVQIKDLIISDDGKTTTISATLVPMPDNSEYADLELRKRIREIVKQESELTGYKFHLNGMPILTAGFVDIAEHDMVVFTPVISLVAFILLLIVFKKMSGAVLPFLVVFFSWLVVISIQVMLGYKLNNFTSNLPAFILALGIADAMHIYWVWLHAMKRGRGNYESIRFTLEKNLLPALLTSLTTFAGFISLSSSKVLPVRTFGIATASAAVMAFFLSVVFVPALLAVMKINVKPSKSIETFNTKSPGYAEKYSSFILKNDTRIIAVSLLLSVLFSIGLFNVRIDNNSIKYFKEDTEIRRSVKFIEDQITGPMTFEIIADSKMEDGIKEPDFLKKVEIFCNDFIRKFKDVRHTGSLLDVVKRFNVVMHGGNDEYNNVPGNKNLIAQYLLLYSMSLPQGMEISDKIDVNERYFRVTASINMMAATEYMDMIKWIEQWWEHTTYSVEVSGQNALFAYMYKNVTDTIIYSISIAVALVTILMMISFRSWKVMVISMLPNILPLILVVGLMGWLNIYIDIGVAISGAVIIGVAVDDTIHFLVKYREARKSGKDLKEALEYMITVSGAAIMFTTFILSASFTVLLFSDFLPSQNFSIITISALFVALAGDLLLLPSLFSLYERIKTVNANKETAQL